MSNSLNSKSLPVVDSSDVRSADRPVLRLLVHAVRVAMFVAIILMIRFANRQQTNAELMNLASLHEDTRLTDLARSAFSDSAHVGPYDSALQGFPVLGETQTRIGQIWMTSPGGDSITGFSGPTNCLLAVNEKHEILDMEIFSSADTLEHVALVERDERFGSTFNGLKNVAGNQWANIDAVSGATLTSYAMVASIAKRVSGSVPELKFNAQPKLANVRKLFATAASTQPTDRASLWSVHSKLGSAKGTVLTTTPTTDALIGYQGPTAAIIGFNLAGQCNGVVVDQTYDNQPYASYLDDDAGFQQLYLGKTVDELMAMDPQSHNIEGVSGATMTSVCVAQGLPLATTATLRKKLSVSALRPTIRHWYSWWPDLITIVLTSIGVAFSFSKNRHQKRLRLIYQVLVIVLLGFVSGHLLSQAAIAGWSSNAIPWRVAPGLVFLSFAAVLIPMISKHQTYCQHVCAFGAIQQLARSPKIRSRIPWQWKIPKRIARGLSTIPFFLLAWVVYVAVSKSVFSLAGIEPFDGFALRVAGWATIAIFVVGIAASLITPMAYCRFGCPTGAMLGFLRFRADSDRLGIRDGAAGLLVALAAALLWF